MDLKHQTLPYANVGHHPTILRRASGTIELLTSTGFALGLFDDLQMSEATITLATGDAIVLYTDGVTEANNPQYNEMYGVNHLTTGIKTAPWKASELLMHIEGDLNTFTNGLPQQDDVTLFVLTKD
jgi:phosphoserine phosphatase RsbU/P